MPERSNKTHKTRPPIVTIMGHVDHGKTTLLDTIRKSHITASEHGGITQHIGAYQIIHEDQPITFIDTPGHAAFSAMRARGAKVTDIVVLVVAADDGVMPQTVESLKHIKESEAQLIVAINKIDLPDASPDKVKAQLTEHETFVEGYGGQTPVIEISAKEGKNLDQLLELITLVAELEELKADSKGELEALVIESELDKRKGPLATLIVKNGTIKTGQEVYTYQDKHTVKAMVSDTGEGIDSAGPGDPVLILGFSTPPVAGTVVTQTPQKALDINTSQPATEFEDEEKIKVIIKADTAGTLEAVVDSLSQDEVLIIKQDVGRISESDVLMAHTTGAQILGFNVTVMSSAAKLARIEEISIHTFNIIYKLLEYLEEAVLEKMEPTLHETVVGSAKIAALFEIGDATIAGCQIESGKIHQDALVHVLRKDTIIADAQITSLKRGKEDIKTAKAGTECGIVLKPQVDFKVGDMIKSYKIDKE